MSSWADIKIGGMTVLQTQNYYHEWYFRKSERTIEYVPARTYYGADDEPSDQTVSVYLYKAKGATIRRRLELQGYDKSALEREFKTQHEQMVRDCAEMIERSPEGKAVTLLPVLQASSLNDWLERLRRINEEKLQSAYFGQAERDYGDVLLNFMLSSDSYYFSDNPGAGNFHFPCTSEESYAVALLEIQPEDVECVLDVTELVNGGWTDSFEDKIEFHQDHTTFYEVFKTSLNEVSELTKLAPQSDALARMLYANVITAMETYLADTLKKQVLKREAIRRRFVLHHDAFNKNSKKYTIAELHAVMDNLLDRVNSEIDKISFHSMESVPGLYKAVLSTTFPDEVGDLIEAIQVRHDIVHRNGKSPQGMRSEISMLEVHAVSALVDRTILHIDRQVKDGLLDGLE